MAIAPTNTKIARVLGWRRTRRLANFFLVFSASFSCGVGLLGLRSAIAASIISTFFPRL
jgi:hypothetical protein